MDADVHSTTPSQIVPFQFEDNPVRTMVDIAGEPWFVAADVCKVLGIANVGNALSRLDDDEKDDIRLADTIGRMQSTVIITESGLYNLVIRSDKPEAKRFRKWITSEVLPSIRKTGAYNAPDLSTRRGLLAAVQMLVDIEDEQRRQADAIKRIEARQDAVDQKQQYFTVFGYANYIGRHLDNRTAQQLGRKASAYSRRHNIHIGQLKDTKYGYVKTYHEDVLKDVFDGFYTQWALEDE